MPTCTTKEFKNKIKEYTLRKLHFWASHFLAMAKTGENAPFHYACWRMVHGDPDRTFRGVAF